MALTEPTGNPREPFQTETMAELHARQGRPGEALAILRRLIETHPGHAAEARWRTRARALEALLEQHAGDALDPETVRIPRAPGVTAVAGRDRLGRGCAVVAWALPPTPSAPALEVLLVVRGPDGVEARTERLPLRASSGRVEIPADGLHAVAAAAGYLHGDGFVPLARSTGR